MLLRTTYTQHCPLEKERKREGKKRTKRVQRAKGLAKINDIS
jgi:hypothetical protein